MAHYPGRQTDQYGNPVPQMDEYGNPIRPAYAQDTPGYGTNTFAGGGAGTDYNVEHHGVSGKLHRSGSSSSSSSEDDGHGGRRKKGIKDKIKEKLPGQHKETQATSTTTPGGVYSAEGQYGEHHEKKGIMDKIKEKLPGHHH